jgi:hypothetical protein
MDTWLFPGAMWLERVADHSFPYNAELIMCGTVPLLFYVPSWCGQQMHLLHLVPLSHISGMLKQKFKCVHCSGHMDKSQYLSYRLELLSVQSVSFS